MTYFSITAQYPIFTDSDGTPLENGYINIGSVNENPIISPISVYWDADLQIEAAQPIRTLAGAPSRSGTPAVLYVPSDFSILIRDKNQVQVYYGPNGVKNFTSSSVDYYKNYIDNGLFLISQHRTLDSQADLWTENYNGYAMTNGRAEFTTTDSRPKNNSKYYMKIGVTGLPGALDSNYARFCTVIEDVTELSNETITLSWFDRYDSLNRYAVSITQIMPDGSSSADVTGIGTQIFYPTADFTLRSLTIGIPSITGSDLDYSDIADLNTSGLMINFWLAAGADYNDETGSLGNVTASAVYNVDITDVRLNKGPVVKSSNSINFAETLRLCQRRYERSNSIYDNDATVTGDGYITFVAGGANTTIPGFRFTKEKRTQSPTIHVYSADSGAIDNVYREGVGDVAVTDYHDVNSTGVGYIELASSTVANNVYKYHWSADDDFTI